MMVDTFRKAITRALFLAATLLAVSAQAAEAPGEGDHAHHAGGQAPGNDPHAHHKAMQARPAQGGNAVKLELADLELVNQNGETVRFASDVVGDKIVVVDFVYTTCTTVCPVLSTLLSQVQNRLGDQLGDEVALVSVTVDPNRDTPQRLKAYAAKHGAREGWTWLTGPKPAVDEVLTRFGAYTSNFEDHPAMVLVGDGRSGEWTRFFGFPSPDQLLAQVDMLVAKRTDGNSLTAH